MPPGAVSLGGWHRSYIEARSRHFDRRLSLPKPVPVVQVDRQHDLNLTEEGYVWHKTIVDSKCFRPIPTVAHFDGKYNMTNFEIDGGHYISKEEYESLEVSQTTEGKSIDS